MPTDRHSSCLLYMDTWRVNIENNVPYQMMPWQWTHPIISKKSEIGPHRIQRIQYKYRIGGEEDCMVCQCVCVGPLLRVSRLSFVHNVHPSVRPFRSSIDHRLGGVHQYSIGNMKRCRHRLDNLPSLPTSMSSILAHS